MLVFLKEHFVLIEMPRCASSSLHSELASRADIVLSGHPFIKHTNYSRGYRLLNGILPSQIPVESLEFYSLIRNPISWLTSWYQYRTRAELANTTHPDHAAFTGKINYLQFMQDCLLEHGRPRHVPSNTQFSFVAHEQGQLGADRVFSYEHLNDFIELLEDKLATSLNVKRLNSSPTDRTNQELELPVKLVGRLNLQYSSDLNLHASALAKGRLGIRKSEYLSCDSPNTLTTRPLP